MIEVREFMPKSKGRLCSLILLLLSASIAGASGVRGAAHVVVLGFDGLAPAFVEHGNTPVMHELMKRGTYSMHARGVIPTNSSPNWAAMIMGAGPAETGITSNDWEPSDFDVPPM